MKRTITTTFFLVLCAGAFAQTHFGVKIGMADSGFRGSDLYDRSITSYNIGGFLEYREFNWMAARLELQYAQRGAGVYEGVARLGGYLNMSGVTRFYVSEPESRMVFVAGAGGFTSYRLSGDFAQLDMGPSLDVGIARGRWRLIANTQVGLIDQVESTVDFERSMSVGLSLEVSIYGKE